MRGEGCPPSTAQAGGNTSFFGRGAQQAEADLGGKMVGTYQPENVRNAIQERLAFTNQVGAKYASMLAFPMFENQMDSAAGGLDTVMSVTSRLLPWDVTGTGSQGMHNSFPGGENVFQAYKAALALDTIHFGEDLRAAESAPPPARPPVRPSAPVTACRLPIASAHCALPPCPRSDQDFISQGSTNNAVCFMGPHRKFGTARAMPTACRCKQAPG